MREGADRGVVTKFTPFLPCETSSNSHVQPVQSHREKGKLLTSKQHSTIETTDEMTSSKTSLDPRSWFQSISREEKAKAMCLGDRKFIKLFLESTRGKSNVFGNGGVVKL